MQRAALFLTILFGATLAGAQNLSGPYVGGYLGGGSADAHWDTSSGTKVDHSLSGGLAGVQGGYNWHRASILFGVQADIGAGSLSGSSRCPNPAFECKTELLSLFTLRGRAGPAFDNFALYATAGVASAGIRTSVDNHANTKSDDTQGHSGWTAGAGMTGLIGRRILWQAEYLHCNFGTEEHILQGVTNKVKVSADIFRIGVHYKFF